MTVPKILYGEADSQVMSSQLMAFQKAGFVVEPAVGRQAIEEAVRHTRFDLVILGHTLTKEDRHHLPYLAKKLDESTRVLVLHNSGKHPKVDIAVDSRDGDRAVMQAVSNLLAQRPQRQAAVA